jgi:hypothetical protein
VVSRTTLLRHPIAIVGVLLTTVSAVLFLSLLAAELAGLFDSPYAGLLIFVLVPAVFVLGLALIPLGMWLEQRSIRRDPTTQRAWAVIDFSRPRTRRWALLIVALTVVNIVIVSIAAGGAVHTMDTPGFCGQTCHTTMEPEFVAWQHAPHAKIKCTACHVGEGARALVRSKLAGTRQLYHVVINEIPKPIKGADMRPALETCGNCHTPSKDHGEPLRIKREYAEDETNTETATTLQMMVGGAGRKTSTGRAIHWHADPAVRIEFVATDADRQTIPYVRVVDGSGAAKEYKADGATDEQIARGERRVMDCIDCHNTQGHRIAPTAEQAVDAALAAGDMARSLPFARREGVRLVKIEHPTQEQGLAAIEKELRAFYAGKAGVDQRDLARTIASVQNVYRRNVFPTMKVTFGVYPNNIGHITSNGCFRCHDGSHMAADGTAINSDCEYCHKQIE